MSSYVENRRRIRGHRTIEISGRPWKQVNVVWARRRTKFRGELQRRARSTRTLLVAQVRSSHSFFLQRAYLPLEKEAQRARGLDGANRDGGGGLTDFSGLPSFIFPLDPERVAIRSVPLSHSSSHTTTRLDTLLHAAAAVEEGESGVSRHRSRFLFLPIETILAQATKCAFSVVRKKGTIPTRNVFG